jgi:hypothetical protein
VFHGCIRLLVAFSGHHYDTSATGSAFNDFMGAGDVFEGNALRNRQALPPADERGIQGQGAGAVTMGDHARVGHAVTELIPTFRGRDPDAHFIWAGLGIRSRDSDWTRGHQRRCAEVHRRFGARRPMLVVDRIVPGDAHEKLT